MANMHAEVQQPIQRLCKTLNSQLGSAFKSLTVVGSAVTDDFISGKSDINSVLVVETVEPSILSFLARIGPSMGRKHLRAPLLMTPSYIQRSCDVFAVEWLDFQAFHQTIEGTDPFESLVFEKHDVRLQCERQLKSAQIQTRQGYITSAEKKGTLAALLTTVAKDLLPFLRAMLWLDDIERNGGFQKTLEQIQTHFSVDTRAFQAALAFRYEKLKLSADAVRALFMQAVGSIESLSQIADRWSTAL